MRNKKIQILLVFVLAIGLFGLLFYWRYGEKKQMESLNGLQETYKEYDKKIREIRNDMENKKAEVNDIEKPANVILAFSEEDQELMDRIVPALEGRGIQATLVLKNTAEHHQETVTYLGQQEVCRHQVILYRRENGAYVLHRVMENSDHNSYVLCGDNQYRKEYGVQPEQILAALTGFYRGNQYIDCEKNKKYKQYVKLWCSPLFPRRCAVWAVKAVMKIRSRASKR